MQGEELVSFIAALWAAGLALPGNLADTTKDGNATVADVATEAELVTAVANPHIVTIVLTNDLILLPKLVRMLRSPGWHARCLPSSPI